jgi:hypothetical protein
MTPIGPADDDDDPRDRRGCLMLALRTGCGMASLWIIMFVTMVLVALFSLLFFR